MSVETPRQDAPPGYAQERAETFWERKKTVDPDQKERLSP
jgi:hypothetical protein